MHTRKSQIVIGAGLFAALFWADRLPAELITFYPTDDTMIRMGSPDSNYGAAEYMDTRNRYGHSSHEPKFEHDVLIRFDLSSLEPDTQIESATLHLYYFKWKDNNPAGRSLNCFRITGDWDEETVTWSAQPTWLPEVSATAIVPDQPGYWMDWSLTADVTAFVSDPSVTNYGWEIMDDVPWGTFNIPFTYFYTKEFANDFGDYTPYLTVDVVPEPATLAILVVAGAVGHRRRR